jgi:hypothetical protein
MFVVSLNVCNKGTTYFIGVQMLKTVKIFQSVVYQQVTEKH